MTKTVRHPPRGGDTVTLETPDEHPFDRGPPKRPTQARLQAFFLRQFARSGSLTDAAARTGIAPRTVQRWRSANPAFGQRYAAVLEARVEMLEDLAMRRAMGADRRPVFHAGKQVATVERHNDVMLMRVLARFDRLRERRAARHHSRQEAYDRAEEDIRLLDEAGRQAALEPRKPWPELSPSMRQVPIPGDGR